MDWAPTFIALLEGCAGAGPLSEVRRAIASRAPDLQPRFDGTGLSLHARAGDQVAASEDGSLVVVGPIYDKAGARSRLDGPEAAPPTFDALLADHWGRYVAFRRRPGTSGWDVLRDPGGGLAAWLVAGSAGLVADELPLWLLDSLHMSVRPDRRLLANALAMPTMTAHRSLLTNATLLAAGTAASWNGERWSSSRLLWPALGRAPAPDADAAAIRKALFTVVRAIAAEGNGAVIELSGGLDSAIVLGALSACRPQFPVVAVNLATRQDSGDERGPARDAAARAGVELIEIAAREEELDYRLALDGPQPAQRIAYGLDSILERSVAGAAGAFMADAILTGQGGDAVFFQFPSDKVAIDHMRATGLASLFSRTALDVARRARISLLRLQWNMLADRWRRVRPDRMPPGMSFLTLEARAAFAPELGDHPWLAAASGLPPGKRLQVFALANCQWFNSPTARARQATLIHPLLAQPVVEACLAMPVYRLSHGTQDRALARTLFADLIPSSVSRRRAKGEASAYYRRSIVHNLPFLRRHLLDGCLVAAGLLDADALDAALAEDAMLWRQDARGIVSLASIESWARHWGV
jgi:asparagine synthase (glutamine-hydrolysing)